MGLIVSDTGQPPLIYVDVYETARRPKPLSDTRPPRPQRWRWRALNGGNRKVLAIASESYTNRQDCIDAATALFGRGSNAYLREAEHGSVELRLASDGPTP